MNAVSQEIPLALSQIMRDRYRYRKMAEEGRFRPGTLVSFYQGRRLDPFRVSDSELKELFRVTGAAADRGSEHFLAGDKGPSTYSMKTRYELESDGSFYVDLHLKKMKDGQDEVRTMRRMCVMEGYCKTGERSGDLDPVFRNYVNGVDRYCETLSEGRKRRFGRAALRSAIREARLALVGNRLDAVKEREDRDRMCTNEKVDSLESYADARMRMMDIRDSCRFDPLANTREVRMRYVVLSEETDRFAAGKELGEALAARAGRRYGEAELCCLAREEAGQREGRDDVSLRSYLVFLAENARDAGYSVRDIEEMVRHNMAGEPVEGFEVSCEVRDACRRVDERKRSDLESNLARVHDHALGGTAGDAIDAVLESLDDRMRQMAGMVAARAFLQENGLREDSGLQQVLDCMVEKDFHVEPDALARLMKADPKELEEQLCAAFDRNMERVWTSSGGGPLDLAGEAEVKSEFRLSAVDILARELQSNAALLHQASPSECGRYLAEAGVRFSGMKSPEAVFMDAAKRMYGTGGIEGARKTQVFRDRFRSTVSEARKSVVRSAGVKNSQKVKPMVAPNKPGLKKF